MVALLGRECVNLPLLCGVAGHSHKVSGPPARGAVIFSLSLFLHRWHFASFSSGWFTDWQGRASIYLSPPFLILSRLGSLCFLHWRLCDPARCFLPFSMVVVKAPEPLFSRPAAVLALFSLCAPRGVRSDPVSADGIFQEHRNLLAVLLHKTIFI